MVPLVLAKDSGFFELTVTPTPDSFFRCRPSADLLNTRQKHFGGITFLGDKLVSWIEREADCILQCRVSVEGRVPILRLNDSIDCVYKMPDRSFVVLYEVLEGGGFEIVECSVLIWVVVVEDVDRDGGGGGSSVGDSMKVEGCSDKVLSVDKSMVQGGLEYDSGVVDGVMEIFKCGGLGDGSKWVKVGVSVGEQRFRWKSVYKTIHSEILELQEIERDFICLRVEIEGCPSLECHSMVLSLELVERIIGEVKVG
ncbi:hypothetical protein Tco_0185569 [Tanacetum coccineum]